LEYIYKRKDRKSASQKGEEQEKLRERETLKEAETEAKNGREQNDEGGGEEQRPAYHLMRSIHLGQGANGTGDEVV